MNWCTTEAETFSWRSALNDVGRGVEAAREAEAARTRARDAVNIISPQEAGLEVASPNSALSTCFRAWMGLASRVAQPFLKGLTAVGELLTALADSYVIWCCVALAFYAYIGRFVGGILDPVVR